MSVCDADVDDKLKVETTGPDGAVASADMFGFDPVVVLGE